ncbi:MAG: PIN domain protein [Deltaproteobacteria bacterium ADurb.Bin026]|jgi:predicted nucleic acid-binding protein|nr:MAG: PIN domain protein [Deltaproteobacteria bacterium ADurb.Bin026]
MVGLDTGYFLGLIQGDTNIVKHWEGLKAQEIVPYVSVLTLGEILYLTIRIGKPEQGRRMTEGIEKTSSIVDMNKQIVERAAALKAGRGIPYVDSVIIASFLENGCKEIHTKDRKHFGEVKGKGLKIVIW